MKGKMTTHVLIASALAALASVGTAQVLNGAANAAGAAQTAIPPAPALPSAPSVPAQPVTPPSVSAGTAAGASSGAAGSVNSPINRPDLGANTNVNAAGRMDSRTNVSPGRAEVNAPSQVTVDSRVNGVGASSMVTGESSASLRTNETMRAIQSTGHATRDQVTANVQERIEATNNLVTELRARADAAGDKSKAAFARAMADVRQREQDVRASLRAAASATGENWGKIQSELAQSYGAYAQAVAQAEVAARATK